MNMVIYMKATAIIASGGTGLRMGSALPKQFISVKGKPILARTLSVFNICTGISEIILTAPAGYEALTENIISAFNFEKAARIITGGNTRQQSVYNALQAVSGADIILIHDAVRPFVTTEEILRTIEAAGIYGACSLGIPVKDTIKICDANGFVIGTPARETLWQIQTPQAFLSGVIMKAHEQALLDGITATDDAELAERIGQPTRIIMGNYANIKITTQEDLLFFQDKAGDIHNTGSVSAFF